MGWLSPWVKAIHSATAVRQPVVQSVVKETLAGEAVLTWKHNMPKAQEWQKTNVAAQGVSRIP